MRLNFYLQRLALGLFLLFTFAFLPTDVVHAQIPTLISQPTGNCPDYLTATGWKPDPSKPTATPGYTIDKVQMQCKQGMCHRCPAKESGTFDTKCALSDATIKTDIPCNYSVEDIFVTALNGVRIIFMLTGAIALALFIWGGFYYWILSAGDSGKIKQGKSLMVNSIIAICITFGAGAIVTFVTRSLGATIGTDSRGGVGQIQADPDNTVDCPINGKQGAACDTQDEESDEAGATAANMVCYYGPDVAHGAQSPTEGVCISACQYRALPPDADLENYACLDRSLLNPQQQRSCQQGLCPGAANIQCCKL